ncbi:MAG TPA: potassium transporter TrkG, partial [bacterium]|nr:potassium transporter TrkG [bacterium]
MAEKSKRNVPAVLRLLGSLLVILGAILLLPLLAGWAWGDGDAVAVAFLLPAAGAAGAGLFLRALTPERDIPPRVAALACTGAWIAFSAVGAVPFMIAVKASFIDSFFETMSGFTTTGITMFTGLDGWPRSLLLWRALTQWIGGLGILTFFLVISRHRSGDHRLFGAESHKVEMGRPVPGLSHTLKILWGIYVSLTLAVGGALVLAGMPVFDSVCHSLTTLSTGGFSPHDASIGFYRQAGYAHFRAIETIVIVGMLLGGINFFIHYRLSKGEWRALGDNTEMRWFWGIAGGAAALILAERLGRTGALPGADTVRDVVFQAVSIMTTTGFATRNIAGPWFGPAARLIFLGLMVVGGCVGSTGGGFKVMRTAMLSKEVWREIFNFRHGRHLVTCVTVDGKAVPVGEIRRAGGLFFAWLGLVAL